MTARISISIPDELAERLNDELEYGDSRSEWVADAIEMKLEAVEGEGDEEGNRARPAMAIAN